METGNRGSHSYSSRVSDEIGKGISRLQVQHLQESKIKYHEEFDGTL